MVKNDVTKEVILKGLSWFWGPDIEWVWKCVLHM